MIKAIGAIFLAGSFLASSAWAADLTPLPPGKPSGVKQAQDANDNTVWYVLGLGVIAGNEATPSLEFYLAAPFWTFARAEWGFKLRFTFWQTVLSVFEAGMHLLFSYLMQLAIVNLDPNAVLTIPTNELQSNNVYILLLVFGTVSTVFVVFFNTIGPGDRGGPWLPRSIASDQQKRAAYNHQFYALLQAVKFIALYLVTGQSYPFDFFYIFATWTQKAPTSGTDYPMIFGWILGAALISIAVLVVITSLLTDIVQKTFSTLIRYGPKRRRFGGYDSDEDLFKEKSSRSTDDTEEDDDDE